MLVGVAEIYWLKEAWGIANRGTVPSLVECPVLEIAQACLQRHALAFEVYQLGYLIESGLSLLYVNTEYAQSQ